MKVDRETVSEEKQEQVRKLLLERISLRGICRVMGVSLDWLLTYLVSLYEDLPEHLNVSLSRSKFHNNGVAGAMMFEMRP